VFDLAENGFDLHIALDTQGSAMLRKQISFGLFPKLAQTETDPQVAIAFGLGAFGLEGASIAASGFIVA